MFDKNLVQSLLKIPTEKNDNIIRIKECVIKESSVDLVAASEKMNTVKAVISASIIAKKADITKKSLPVLYSL